MSKQKDKKTGAFTKETRETLVSNAAVHDEIIIAKSEWNKICEKINQIIIERRFDLFSLLLGVIFTKAIDLGYDIFKKNDYSLVLISIYLGIFFVYIVSQKYFNFLGRNNDEANRIHLNDIKQWIQDINKKCH